MIWIRNTNLLSFYPHVENMYDRIIAKRGEEWVNKTSVTPPLTSACNKPEK